MVLCNETIELVCFKLKQKQRTVLDLTKAMAFSLRQIPKQQIHANESSFLKRETLYHIICKFTQRRHWIRTR